MSRRVPTTVGRSFFRVFAVTGALGFALPLSSGPLLDRVIAPAEADCREYDPGDPYCTLIPAKESQSASSGRPVLAGLDNTGNPVPSGTLPGIDLRGYFLVPARKEEGNGTFALPETGFRGEPGQATRATRIQLGNQGCGESTRVAVNPEATSATRNTWDGAGDGTWGCLTEGNSHHPKQRAIGLFELPLLLKFTVPFR